MSILQTLADPAFYYFFPPEINGPAFSVAASALIVRKTSEDLMAWRALVRYQ